MTRVLIYCRISLDETGERAGVERQLGACRRFVETRGWEVIEELVDNDVSATSGKRRPAFERLLDTPCDAIVTWHTDRLVRVTADLERVIALGVNVHAIEAGYLDLSTPAGRATARTLTAWATYEGEQKALRQRLANQQRATEGRPWWNKRPFGYEQDGTLREEEAALLRAAYADVIAGKSQMQVAREWNDLGVTTVEGNPWRGPKVSGLLANPRYCGQRVYKGEVVGQGAWEPIVSEETWRALMRQRAGRRGNPTGRAPQHLLSGLARCRKGAKMQYGYAGNRRTQAQYRCTTCGCTSFRAEWADLVVTELVLALLSDPDAARVFARESGTDVEAVAAEAADLRSRLQALAEDYAEGLLDRRQMLAGTERLRERLRLAEEALATAGRGSVLEGLLNPETVEEEWKGFELHRQRGVIETLTKRITLLPPGRGAKVLDASLVRVEWIAQEAPQPA